MRLPSECTIEEQSEDARSLVCPPSQKSVSVSLGATSDLALLFVEEMYAHQSSLHASWRSDLVAHFSRSGTMVTVVCDLKWLYRIAYHCCVRQLERRKQERALQAAMQAEWILEGVNKEKQAEDIVERHDWQAIVREQLEKLPDKYRMVLILRHLQEMTYEEMADILTIPVGMIKTHLFRARHLLKERLSNAFSSAPVNTGEKKS